MKVAVFRSMTFSKNDLSRGEMPLEVLKLDSDSDYYHSRLSSISFRIWSSVLGNFGKELSLECFEWPIESIVDSLLVLLWSGRNELVDLKEAEWILESREVAVGQNLEVFEVLYLPNDPDLRRDADDKLETARSDGTSSGEVIDVGGSRTQCLISERIWVMFSLYLRSVAVHCERQTPI